MNYSGKAKFIHTEQIKRLYTQSPLGFIASFINSSLIVLVLWNDRNLAYILTWLGLVLVLVLVRTVLQRQHAGDTRKEDNIREWQSRFVWTLLMTGAVWGSVSIFLLQSNSVAYQAFVGFVLGGMVAGSVGIHSAYLPAFLLFSYPALLPFIAVLASIGDRLHLVMAGMTLLFLVLMTATAKRLNIMLQKQLALRFENNVLIKNLKAEIEDRKGAEKELLEIKNQIEDEVRHLEDDLQKAQKMEAIGRLAGGVAHDLNNILSGLVSYPDLLLEDLQKSHPFYEPLETIRQSGMKAADIVQDLLTLARRGIANKRIVNLNNVITDYLATKEHETAVKRHGKVEVTTDLSQDLLNIRGSEVHLTKSVMNLLTNAVSTMPKGGRIHIVTENRYVDSELAGYDTVQEGEYAVMVITDTGVGMSTEMKEHIFEPFYTKKRFGKSGSGLGMAVVWGTVKDHDGYIELESSEGEGSTFSVYFPATREEPRAALESRTKEVHHGRGETVLVVDDVAQQRDLAQMILEKLGYVTLTASSGEEAIQMVKETPVDLLLLDMIMNPGMDGLETYREIVGLRAEQKAVIASGFSDGDRVKEAQKLGAGAYIRKPYTLKTLAEAVRLELDR